MIEIEIPGQRTYKIKNLVLDLNGTLSFDGKIIDGVKERLGLLHNVVDIFIVTADTRGIAQDLAETLQVEIRIIQRNNEQSQKLKLVEELGSDSTVAVGNGTNDALMLQKAALGICVLGMEGASIEALNHSRLVVTDVNMAMDLLLKPQRLIATLRR